MRATSRTLVFQLVKDSSYREHEHTWSPDKVHDNEKVHIIQLLVRIFFHDINYVRKRPFVPLTLGLFLNIKPLNLVEIVELISAEWDLWGSGFLDLRQIWFSWTTLSFSPRFQLSPLIFITPPETFQVASSFYKLRSYLPLLSQWEAEIPGGVHSHYWEGTG